MPLPTGEDMLELVSGAVTDRVDPEMNAFMHVSYIPFLPPSLCFLSPHFYLFIIVFFPGGENRNQK